MKNKKQQIGVLAILKNNDKYLFIKRHPKSKYEGGKWGFVGENIEFGEQPTDTLKRGVKEELGLEIDNFKLFNVYSGVWEITDEIKQVILIAYIINVGNVDVRINSEAEAFRWLTLKEAKKLDLIKHNDKVLSDLDKI
jgi:mutator protein MutT